MDRTVYVLI